MTAQRFLVLRGTHDGPLYLAPESPFGAIRWTGDRAGARRFDDRADADAVQSYLVGSTGFAVAVVPLTDVAVM